MQLKKNKGFGVTVPIYNRAAKRDTSLLRVKVELRTYFLDKYHRDTPPIVFDACRGYRDIWNEILDKEKFPVSSYWGVDKKRLPGVMYIDSVRVLSQPGWDFDVIDVDTYGSPWAHWIEICKNIQKPTTVFLTIGTVSAGGLVGARGLSNVEKRVLNLNFKNPLVPRGLLYKVGKYFVIPTMLSLVEVDEAKEAFPQPRDVRYIGIRIKPKRREVINASYLSA